MRLLLALILTCVAVVAQAESRRTKSTQLFCRNQQDLLTFVLVAGSKDAKERNVPGCMVLKKGVRYQVLDDLALLQGQRGALKVRLERFPTWRSPPTEGYLMRVED
jgi:hypothetical protein